MSPATAALPTLVEWLPRQRWYRSKQRSIADVSVVDAATLLTRTRWLLLDVAYRDGERERYQVLLAPVDDIGDATVIFAGAPWVDATADPPVFGELARLAADGDRLTTDGGATIVGHPGATRPIPADARTLGVEQSNSSAVFGDVAVLKVFRLVEPGVHPDVELTSALTAAGSIDVPTQIGALTWTPDGGEPTALGVVSAFVAGARDAWALAVDDASDAVETGVAEPRALLTRLGELGAAVARVHADLAASLDHCPAAPDDVAGWADAIRSQVDRVLGDDAAPVPATAVAAAVDSAERAVADPGHLIRVHGDLHLGQVIAGDHGWQILDFEGEPTRPLAQRRAASAPARDVAGMLRSFDYAAAAGLRRTGDPAADTLPAPLHAWRDAARRSFLDGYERQAGVPVDPALLALFELEKAVYEIDYERAYRPDWLAIPVGGVRRILARTGSDGNAGVTRTTRGTSMSTTQWHADDQEVAALLAGTHKDPHHVLGLHDHRDGTVVRVLRPGADAVTVVPTDGDPVEATRTDDGGMFEALVAAKLRPADYRLRFRSDDDHTYETHDPYAFWPTLGDIDLHLVGEGRHEELWRRLGAHVTTIDGVTGTSFAVWAPNAQSVRVVGSFNDWDGRRYPMRVLGSGVWELFVPGAAPGDRYKYEVLRSDDFLTLHADPYAEWTEAPPENSSRVFSSEYEWQDAAWMDSRPGQQWHGRPLSIYEVHLGSWRTEDGHPLTYRQLAHQLAEYADEMAFTHVELLPVAEHPFTGSWGYQVTGHFAPTARFGDPDDFRYLVDHLHRHGIGVIIDWVPAHFPKDEWALAKFDGTALYEHADPRQGEHPDWGTLVFNFGRNEVRNFLLSSALFWLEELHVDGLRVDAVASMLYLDYSREEGQWVPNAYGGNENLEAIEFLKETATVVYGRNPGALLIAEESTAWPGVSRPVHLGGLGFGFKWNMGWMHDTLSYLSRDPIHRRFHHGELTFGLLYAWSENYVLPLSHDEVVHGKRSLIDKMPGDRWQKFANLRALYGYMWAHPGKQVLFMGGEFGQWREWSEATSLDWHLLDEDDHRGLQRLVGDLNRTYRDLPSLWQRDHQPEGFGWIDANNADANVLSFVRYADDDTPLVCVVNFSPTVRDDQRFGMPRAGTWRELLNTDAESYGGSNVGNMGAITAEQVPWHGMTASAQLVVPPLATLWLVPDDD